MSNFISRGIKSVRKALHLPPITVGNVLTKYAPAAIAMGAGGPIGAAISKIPMGGAVLKAGSAIGAAGGLKPQPRSLPTLPGYSNPVNLPSGTETATDPGGGSGWLGTLMGGIGGLAKKAIDNPMDTALGGLAVAQGVNSAKAAAQQGKYSDAAIANAKERWAAQAPLRNQGINGMLNKSTHDYSSVYTDPQNPFAASMRKAIPQPTMPAVPTRPVLNPPPRFGAGPTATLPRAKRPLLLPGGPKLLPSRAG